ncbi:MAG: DHHA1 domain-containing protein [Methanobacteriota archaeon]
MELYRVMDFVLVTSEVNSFGASAARALVLLGAACAFVGSVRKNEIQISARASSNFIKKTGIGLGRDITPKIGEFINGSGGGHAGAAGAKGRGNSVSKALAECIKLVQKFLHAPKKK